MDKFKNLPPQYKLLVGVGALGVVASLFYYLVIMGLDDQITQQRGEFTRIQSELAQFKDFRGDVELAELREAYAEVVRRIEQNKRLIPDKEMVPELMSGIEADALEAGLRVISKEQLEKEYEDFYERIPIRLKMRGSFLSLVRFLKLTSRPEKRLATISNMAVKVLKTNVRKQEKSSSPFSGSSGVAAAESELSIELTVTGYAGKPANADATVAAKKKGKASPGDKKK